MILLFSYYKKYHVIKNTIIILSLIFLNIACQESTSKPTAPTQKLGHTELEVTGNPAAQANFKQGLLLLHSFEYYDARTAFVQAQQQDRNCVMAYWGEALAYNHILFQRELLPMAHQALQKLGPTKELRIQKATTDLEMDLLSSVEILYGTGTKQERDIAYSKQLAQLTQKYPQNHEVSALYAISLLSASQTEKKQDRYLRSAKICEGILTENPAHPGALHYLIHSYDYPSHAHLALSAADSYSKVAPDAAHALHMPSHIYIALGRWNDVVNSNIAAWNASVNGMVGKPGKVLSYHSLNWLQYGLFQRDETELATRLVHDMKRYTEGKPTPLARSYLVDMKGAHMVETNTWSGPIADWPIRIEDLHILKRGAYAYLEGMKAAQSKDQVALSNIIQQLKKDKYTASLDLNQTANPMCSSSGNPNVPPTQIDIDMVTIMVMQLEAALHQLQGSKSKMLVALEQAVAIEDRLTYNFGPPHIFKPVQETYAEALMQDKNYEAALAAYRACLIKHPRRLMTLKGMRQIAIATGDNSLLEEINKELKISTTSYERERVL